MSGGVFVRVVFVRVVFVRGGFCPTSVGVGGLGACVYIFRDVHQVPHLRIKYRVYIFTHTHTYNYMYAHKHIFIFPYAVT